MGTEPCQCLGIVSLFMQCAYVSWPKPETVPPYAGSITEGQRHTWTSSRLFLLKADAALFHFACAADAVEAQLLYRHCFGVHSAWHWCLHLHPGYKEEVNATLWQRQHSILVIAPSVRQLSHAGGWHLEWAPSCDWLFISAASMQRFWWAPGTGA